MSERESSLVRFGCPVVLLVTACLFLWEPLSTGTLIAGLDIVSVVYPTRDLTFELLRSGRMPSWNPYIFCGMPLLGQIQNAAFYPLNVAHWILPTRLAVNYTVLIHLFLAGLFSLLFLRVTGARALPALAGSFGYAFGGIPIAYVLAGHITPLNSLTWIPALFLCVHHIARGRFPLARLGGGAIVVGMQMMGGHPQIVLYSLMCAFLYMVLSPASDGQTLKAMGKRTLVFVAAIVFAAGIAAVEVAPAAEFARHSDRPSKLPYEFVVSDSMPPEKFITFIAPDFFGNVLNSTYWGRESWWNTTAFISVPLLLLAPLAFGGESKRTSIVLAIVLVVSLVLALGGFTPVFRALYALPVFGQFRNPARFLGIVSFAAAMLGALGFDALLASSPPHATRGYSVVLLGVTAVILVCAVLVYAATPESGLWQWLMRAWGNQAAVESLSSGALRRVAALSLARGAGLCALTAVVVLMTATRKLPVWIPAAALAVTVLLDLYGANRRFVMGMPEEEYLLPVDLVEFVKSRVGPYRVGMRARFPQRNAADRAMLYGLRNAFGYEGQIPGRYAAYLANAAPENHPLAIAYSQAVSDLGSPSMRLLAVKYLIQLSDEDPSARVRYPLVFRSGEYSVFEIGSAMPRAFLVSRVIEAGEKETLDLLRSEDFDPASATIIPPGSRLPFPLDSMDVSEGAVKFREDLLARVVLEVETPGNSLLVLADTHFPGWRARLDGQPAEIIRADYMFRAVAVPAGRHVVEFEYRPASIRLGIGITVASVSALILLFILLVHGRSRTNMD
jgi:hypothetical protein